MEMMKKWLKILLILLLMLGFLPEAALASQDEGTPDVVRLPILMYHSVLADPKAQGKYVVSPALLESDFKYLVRRGYESVTLVQLVNYVHGTGELPEKPVLITFDDGFLNNMTYALPLLEKYDLHAVISIVGTYTEKFSEKTDPNPSYAHMTWDDIAAGAATGRLEFGNHTYNMHRMGVRRGCARKWGESEEDYREDFLADVSKLQTTMLERCGFAPIAFTYPFGVSCDESLPLVRELGFHLSFTCYEKVNEITRDPECLFLLGRFNRPGGVSTASFMQKIKLS